MQVKSTANPLPTQNPAPETIAAQEKMVLNPKTSAKIVPVLITTTQQADAVPAITTVAAAPAAKTAANPTVVKIVPESAPNSKSTGRYLLQVAAVKDYAVADRMKAELTMMGYDVSLQDYQFNGQTWNRVLVGSFDSKQIAVSQQKRLKQNNFGSILIKE